MSMHPPSPVARIVKAQFGTQDGVFGLHLRLSFGGASMSDYTLTDLGEMEQVMASFRARTLEDLVDRKMRIRQYPAEVRL